MAIAFSSLRGQYQCQLSKVGVAAVTSIFTNKLSHICFWLSQLAGGKIARQNQFIDAHQCIVTIVVVEHLQCASKPLVNWFAIEPHKQEQKRESIQKVTLTFNQICVSLIKISNVEEILASKQNLEDAFSFPTVLLLL